MGYFFILLLAASIVATVIYYKNLDPNVLENYNIYTQIQNKKIFK